MSEEIRRVKGTGQRRLVVSRIFRSASEFGAGEISSRKQRERGGNIIKPAAAAAFQNLGISRQRAMLLVARRLVIPASWINCGAGTWQQRRGLWLKD
jgi:hypothetical protein